MTRQDARRKDRRQQFGPAQVIVQFVRILIAKQAGNALMRQAEQAQHPQFFQQDVAPLADRLGLRQAAEPAPGAYAGVHRGDIAQVFVEPGTLGLGTDVLANTHLIAVPQRPVKGEG